MRGASLDRQCSSDMEAPMTSSVSTSVQFDGSAWSESIDPLFRNPADVDRQVARPILVATSGGKAASAAIRLAAELASRDGSEVEALLVERTLPSVPGVCVTAAA